MKIRKPFVCRRGHIFMSLVEMKRGRIRICTTCHVPVPDSEMCAGMSEARGKSPARQRRYGDVFDQVFVRGRIVTRQLSKA